MHVQSNLSLFLDNMLEKSIVKEIEYFKILKQLNNKELKSIVDKKHQEACLQTAELKQFFLQSEIVPYPNKLNAKIKLKSWLDAEDTLQYSDDLKMINQIILAEERCIEDYDKILMDSNLPTNIRKLLAKQKISLEKNLSELRVIWGSNS